MRNTENRRSRPALVATLLLGGIACGAPGRIACVGNSITYGYGLSNPSAQSYPTRLDSLLGGADTVGNFGVSSKTIIKEVGDSYWSQSAFAAALAFRPDRVVVELGTNDSKNYIWPYYDTFFAPDYKLMIDTFQHLASRPRVLICLVPHASDASWGMYDTTIVDQVDPAIREVALEKGVDLIDLYTALADWSLFQMADSVHPTAAGALKLAQTVQSVLAQVPFAVSVSGKTFTSPQAASYQWYREDTLLPGATARTLAVSDAARYKVSIQPSSGSATRIVSDEAVAGATSTRRAARAPEFDVVLQANSRTLQVASPAAPVFALTVWDASGRVRLRATSRSGWLDLPLGTGFIRGVYPYEVRSGSLRRTGNIVLAR